MLTTMRDPTDIYNHWLGILPYDNYN